jgi:hypothetical protein
LFGGVPANGNHDFEFRLFSDPDGSAQVGPVVPLTLVNVNNGVFSVRLDFGNQFPGANRYLEIRVRQTGEEFYTVLAPRQAITSSPYAVKSLNAENAVNATQLGGIDQTQFVRTTDTRLTDARSPLPNSASYIQNTSSQQTNSNFNVSGTGTANILKATTQFNIGDDRILSAAFPGNLFAGVGAGSSMVGESNSFFGKSAGEFLVGGNNNSFFGMSAGRSNSPASFTAQSNSFFGAFAGTNITTGFNNSFFGQGSGRNHTTGDNNSFFGGNTGNGNTTGTNNSLFGTLANLADGLTNATAIGHRAFVQQNNSIVLGSINGVNNANANTFVGIGTTTPSAKLTVGGSGAYNTSSAARFDLVNSVANAGYLQNVTDTGLWQLATTAGATRMVVDPSGNVGIGTITPSATLQVRANNQNILIGHAGCNSGFAGIGFGASLSGCNNYSMLGNGTDTLINRPAGGTLYFREGNATQMFISPGGAVTIPGNLIVNGTLNASFPSNLGGYIQNTTTQQASSNFNISGNGTVGGTLSGSSIVAAFGAASVRMGNSGCSGTPGAIPGGAIGFNGLSCVNYSFGGDGSNTFIKAPSGNISFRVGGVESMRIDSSGAVSISTPGSAGTTHLCINGSDQISFCSSSIRYKSNINSFGSGLSLIKKLRPVYFNWKSNNSLDFGLVAEEVAEVEPLLITRNNNGVIEGVKYDHVGVVLVNAVNEQQQQIESQQEENRQQKDLIKEQQTQIKDLQKQLQQQQALIEGLRRLTCQSNPKAGICKEGSRDE